MGQMMLLLVDFEEEVEPNHLVRVANAAIGKMDLRVVYEQYKGGETSSYHPQMMLKVLIYAYTRQIYSNGHRGAVCGQFQRASAARWSTTQAGDCRQRLWQPGKLR